MARRPQPWKDSDSPDERCVFCLARYGKFRAGLSTADAQMAVAASLRTTYDSTAGTTAGALLSEDDAAELSAGNAMRIAGDHKRAAWSGAHGLGRCVADVRAHGAALPADERERNLARLVALLVTEELDEQRAAHVRRARMATGDGCYDDTAPIAPTTSNDCYAPF